MANSSSLQNNPGKVLSWWWLFWQTLIAVTVAAVCCVLVSVPAGYSALLGGCISILANAYFAWRAFAHNGARNAVRIVLSLYAGEALKLMLAALGLALAFNWGHVQPGPTLLGFVVVYLSSLVVAGILSIRQAG